MERTVYCESGLNLIRLVRRMNNSEEAQIKPTLETVLERINSLGAKT